MKHRPLFGDVPNRVRPATWRKRPFAALHNVWKYRTLEREAYGMGKQGESMQKKWIDLGAEQKRQNSPEP
jgi:hypothetical protein